MEIRLKVFAATALALATAFAVRSQAAPLSCQQVCKKAQDKARADKKEVGLEKELWELRWNLNGDVVRYPSDFSAAEELLALISNFYSKRSARDVSTETMTLLMAKCFPEGYVNKEYARLPEIAKTVHVTKSLDIAKDLYQCK